MNHKEKCNELKRVRKELADQIGVELNQTECTFEGECKGTCPKCESEEKKLNKALLSSKIAVAGIALSALPLTGCAFDSSSLTPVNRPASGTEIEELAGDVPNVVDGDVEYDPLSEDGEGECEGEDDGENGRKTEALEGDVEYVPDNQGKDNADSEETEE